MLCIHNQRVKEPNHKGSAQKYYGKHSLNKASISLSIN